MNSEKLLKNIYFHYLDSSVNLIAESFIPDWVFAVSDGSGANFLSWGSRQPQRHIAIWKGDCITKR